MNSPSAFDVSLLRSSPQGVHPVDRSFLEVLLPIQSPGSVGTPTETITYGTYLDEIKKVLVDRRRELERALAEQNGQPCGAVSAVEIIVEKHGSDYHPARIRVNSEAGFQSFVMNTALTDRGRDRLQREFDLLRELGKADGQRFLPRVYFVAESRKIESLGMKKMTMFLGEWLEGYHEFHSSPDPEANIQRLKVWDTDEGYRFLSFWEESELFRQAAFILTFHYDTADFREIFPWHHAAGDFVVSLQGGKVRVKLITVRQYEARSVFDEDSRDNALHALLLFLISLTMRMRLDRQDGVGKTTWAGGDHVLEAAVQGFVAALKAKTGLGHCDRLFIRRFSRFAAGTSLEELAQLAGAVAESYDEQAPDSPVVREHVVDHVLALHRRLMRLPADL